MDYKIAEAETHLTVMVDCPYCESYQDIQNNDSVRESMGFKLSTTDAELEITCDKCGKIFIVNDILY